MKHLLQMGQSRSLYESVKTCQPGPVSAQLIRKYYLFKWNTRKYFAQKNFSVMYVAVCTSMFVKLTEVLGSLIVALQIYYLNVFNSYLIYSC